MGEKALGLYKTLLTEKIASCEIVERCNAIRKALRYNTFSHAPFNYLKCRTAFEFSKIRRFLKPPGVMIAILGVDGAGKSTVINAIKPILDTATHNATFVQHLRPSLFPPLARLKGKKALHEGPVLDPHASTPSGVLGSLLRLIYLTLDYILGYWLLIRPKIAKQPAVVLFDRYAYDMAFDPRRFRIDLPNSLVGWFSDLAPKPDLILCLHAKPETIAARKQELPINEINRQVDRLKAFADKEKRAVLISTEMSIDKVSEQIMQTLLKYFVRRGKNKHFRLKSMT